MLQEMKQKLGHAKRRDFREMHNRRQCSSRWALLDWAAAVTILMAAMVAVTTLMAAMVAVMVAMVTLTVAMENRLQPLHRLD
jgi:hypothetical protein